MTKTRYDFITSKLVQMCAEDCRPLSIAEGKGFKEFCSAMNPAYKPPVHATLKAHLDLEYEKRKKEIISQLKDKDVAITTDIWSSLAREGYISATYHFITDDWQLRSGVLATRHMPESHSGVNIAAKIESIREEFGIKKENVAGISRDNASNYDLAMNILGYPSTSCFGHTLQLALASALKHPAITRCISACKEVVGHFNHSPKATGELRKNNGTALIQDVATRWNSTYYMMKSLLPNRAAIYTVLHNKDFTKPEKARGLEIQNEDWILMEKLCEVLEPFDVATKQMSAELYPTLGSVFPLIHGVVENHLKEKPEDTEEIKFFKTTVVKAIQNRFQLGNEENCDDIVATALHPVYKKLKFLTSERKQKVIFRLQEMCSKISPPTGKPECMEPAAKKVKTEPEHSEAAMKYLLGEIYEVSDEEDDDVESEVARYMAQPSKREHPLIWWKSNGHLYPHLEKIAKRFLCRPSTSVPSERLFSAAGNIVTKKRTRLDVGTVDELLFLHSYFKRREEQQVPQDVKAEPEASTSARNESPPFSNMKQEA